MGTPGSITSCKVYDGFGGALLATSPNTANIASNLNPPYVFSFTGLNLTAGQVYYVEFVMTYQVNITVFSGSPYSGGTAYINNVMKSYDLPFKIIHTTTKPVWENLH